MLTKKAIVGKTFLSAIQHLSDLIHIWTANSFSISIKPSETSGFHFSRYAVWAHNHGVKLNTNDSTKS